MIFVELDERRGAVAENKNGQINQGIIKILQKNSLTSWLDIIDNCMHFILAAE